MYIHLVEVKDISHLKKEVIMEITLDNWNGSHCKEEVYHINSSERLLEILEKLEKIEKDGIGLRRNEGFGRVRICSEREFEIYKTSVGEDYV